MMDHKSRTKHLNTSSDAFLVNTKEFYWKTKICHKWEVTGQCRYGKRCNYAHGQSELRLPGATQEAEASRLKEKEAEESESKEKEAEEKKQLQLKKWKIGKRITGIYGDWLDGYIFRRRTYQEKGTAEYGLGFCQHL